MKSISLISLLFLAAPLVSAQAPVSLMAERADVVAGERFVLFVHVGDDGAAADNLFGFGFELTYEAAAFSITRVQPGPFLERDYDGAVLLNFQGAVNATPGVAPYSLTRVRPHPGVTGAGVVALFAVDVRHDAAEGAYTFSLGDISGKDPNGGTVALTAATPLSITVETTQDDTRRSTVAKGDPPPIAYADLNISLDFAGVDTLLDVTVTATGGAPNQPPSSTQYTVLGNQFWDIDVTRPDDYTGAGGSSVDICFPLLILPAGTDADALIVLKREDDVSPWRELPTDVRGQDVCAVGVTDFSAFVIAEPAPPPPPPPANNPPAAADDAATLDEDGTAVINVLANDSDPDGDDLSVTIVIAPKHGAAEVSGTTINYTPEANYNGLDTLTYQIDDGNGGSAQALVTLTIRAVNDAPGAAAITSPAPGASLVIEGDSGVPFTVEWNEALNIDGDALTYTWQLAPEEAFDDPWLDSDALDERSFSSTFGVVAGALTDNGVATGETITLYHRVVTSDGDTTTAGAPTEITLTRGAITALEGPGMLPETFTLRQNYPNPFSQNTTIRYGLPQPAEVKISLVNVLGQVVRILVHDRLQAGWHTARLTTDALPNGVYFYRLETGDFSEVRKMLVIK